ncbi:MAG: hypothetical protein FD122_1677 [Stygiobacter sp.]|nr:MAG: hypothetical protein FD122_1677 [Stygiobacter sp.]KAF0216632.1 MAG: hypothetical protein FD178_1096 [Ignavibacteria bacterium]
MPVSMKKIANDVVASLKKKPSPDKSSSSFWDFMKEQLYSDSTWDQNDLKTIEKEIGVHLSKLEKKELTDMWKSTDVGMDKFDEGKKADAAEMKEDLTADILGQVMDRMDDNYSGGSLYQSSGAFYATEEDTSKKSKGVDEDEIEEKEPGGLADDNLNLDDEDIFGDEDLSEDEEESF